MCHFMHQLSANEGPLYGTLTLYAETLRLPREADCCRRAATKALRPAKVLVVAVRASMAAGVNQGS